MSLKRLASLAFWALAAVIVVHCSYTMLADAHRMGGREGLVWASVLLLGLIVGAVLTVLPAKRG